MGGYTSKLADALALMVLVLAAAVLALLLAVVVSGLLYGCSERRREQVAPEQRVKAETQQAERERQRVEAERLHADAERLRVDAERQRTEAMKQRTVAAWQALQAVDAQMSSREYDLVSSSFQDRAYRYSLISVDGADPVLVELIRASVEASQKTARTIRALEQELAEIQGVTEAGAGLGALFGLFAGDGDSAEDDAAMGALLGALFGESARQDAQAEILKRWQKPLQDLDAMYVRLAEQEKVVSRKLEATYGTPFLDVF